MAGFHEDDGPGGATPWQGRIEPTLGPLPGADKCTSEASPPPRHKKTQSGVPVFQRRAPERSRIAGSQNASGRNAWARFWAQREGAPDPPSLAANARPHAAGNSNSPTAAIWAAEVRPVQSTASFLRCYALPLKVAAICAALAAVWFAATMAYYTFTIRDPMAIHGTKAPTLRILSRGGGLLAERDSKHLYMPLDMLPDHVTNAVVAIEDRRFYRHNGVDLGGLLRAALANLRAGRYAQGGSTLTQQLAKNMYLSPERTILRKLDELTLAMWLEMRLAKRQILELYLNQVYFGGGAYGIEAAAQRHFGKSARALSIVEAAIVAGLLKAPSRYSPTSNPAAARQRGRVVLQAMNESGFLSDKELDAALAEPVRFARDTSDRATDGTEYATDIILERMPELIGAGTDTIIVETTIDTDLQKLAQRQLTDTLVREGSRLKAGQGAVVVLDSSGGIRAIVGGADYQQSQFNRATRAERQPGSTFKPFVYLSALESGMTPDTLAQDGPVNISGWSPRNANGRYRGDVTLRDALATSINTVAVRLGQDVGPSKVAAMARRAGIKSRLREDASLALGTSEVNLLDLTSAYTMFANGGRRVEPYVISRVLSSSGRILYANASDNSASVVDLRHIGAMNDMLNAALVAGTGRKAALATHPAAGKTGTSQDFRDAWFVGYTAHLTAGIWLGNDNGDPMDRVVGGSLPAKMWHAIMSNAHASLAPLPLPGSYRPVLRTPQIDRLADAAPTPGSKAPRTLAPVASPPLPDRFRKVRSRPVARHTFMPRPAPPTTPESGRQFAVKPHPVESISPDFIAKAIDAVPQKVAAPARNIAGAPAGFDLDEIRRRLDEAPDAPSGSVARKPYMALGAGGER